MVGWLVGKSKVRDHDESSIAIESLILFTVLNGFWILAAFDA